MGCAHPGEVSLGSVGKTMKRLFLGIGLIGLLCLIGPSRAEESKVELKLVKYDELSKLLADQKGKVVVIDFWADT
jgi:hypothetical protein